METVVAFHVRDPETDATVRKLARKTGMTITDAIKTAAAEKLDRLERAEAAKDKRPFIDSIRDIQQEVAGFPKTGLKADKAFFDSLSGED
jgi:antitoxin VapB